MSTLGSERNNSSAMCPTCSFFQSRCLHPSTLDSRLPTIAASSTTGTRYLRGITLLPVPTAPRLSFSFYLFSLFLCTLGNDNLHFGHSHVALVHVQFSFSVFVFIFTNIFPSIFLSIRHNDDSYIHSLTTPHAPYYQSRFLSRDSKCI